MISGRVISIKIPELGFSPSGELPGKPITLAGAILRATDSKKLSSEVNNIRTDTFSPNSDISRRNDLNAERTLPKPENKVKPPASQQNQQIF